jgi:hypothetical protein
MIILLAVAAAVISTPIIAAVIVAIASLREESVHSLCSRPPGRIAALARRLLGFQAHGMAYLIRPRVPKPRAAADENQCASRPFATPKS